MTAVQETENQRLVECIISSLDESFGEDVQRVIFYNFRNRTGLSISDAAERPEAFSEFLRGMFGDRGSVIIEKAITNEIQTTFALPADDHSSLEAAISAAKVPKAADNSSYLSSFGKWLVGKAK